MIREERDARFWVCVSEHPSVKPTTKLDPDSWPDFLARADVRPMALEHGGHLFAAMDCLGRAWELHSLFTPDGWGAEVNLALKQALGSLGDWDLIVTHEVAGWWRSQPPRSYGFRPAGAFHGSAIGELRTWILTRAAWEASPVHRRWVGSCLQ
jgi:hypothetical protein